MNEEELRERVEQLKRELLIRCNQSETAIEMPLLYRTAQWAWTEDPQRLADLTGIELVQVHRISAAFRFMGTWPLSSNEESCSAVRHLVRKHAG
jgi:hypothetical protein